MVKIVKYPSDLAYDAESVNFGGKKRVVRFLAGFASAVGNRQLEVDHRRPPVVASTVRRSKSGAAGSHFKT